MLAPETQYLRFSGVGAGSPFSTKVFFSFINKEKDVYTLLHPSYFCRDLLVDWLYNRKGYVKTLPQPDKGITRLFIHSSKTNISRMIKNAKHLHAFEEEAKIPITKFIRYDDCGLIVEGSLWWQSACWKISLYSFLLKTLAYVKATPWKKAYNEIIYVNKINENRTLLSLNIKNRKEITRRNTPNVEAMYNYWWSATNAGFYSVLQLIHHPQKKIMLEYQKKQNLKIGK